MEIFHINNFTGGWFIGDFEPSLLRMREMEVAVKSYTKGSREKKHLHRIATEFTVVLDGSVKMNGREYGSGTIIKIFPGESADFEALTDVQTVVVKIPSVKNDKYLV